MDIKRVLRVPSILGVGAYSEDVAEVMNFRIHFYRVFLPRNFEKILEVTIFWTGFRKSQKFIDGVVTIETQQHVKSTFY